MDKLQNRKFMEEIARIKQPELFLGVARILKVKLLEEDKSPRSFEDMFEELMENYSKENRKRRRELLEILREANHDLEKSKKVKVEDVGVEEGVEEDVEEGVEEGIVNGD